MGNRPQTKPDRCTPVPRAHSRRPGTQGCKRVLKGESTMTRTQIYGQTAMAAGLLFGAALAPAQTVVGWGDNGDGETAVPAGAYRAVTAGSLHALGVNSDGTVTAWGSNQYGQATVPTGLTGVTAVGARPGYSRAVRPQLGVEFQRRRDCLGEQSVRSNHDTSGPQRRDRHRRRRQPQPGAAEQWHSGRLGR